MCASFSKKSHQLDDKKNTRSEELYEDVITKNFSIISQLLKKLNELFTRHEQFENEIEKVYKKMTKLQNQLNAIHSEHRKNNLRIQSNEESLKCDLEGLKCQIFDFKDQIAQKKFDCFIDYQKANLQKKQGSKDDESETDGLNEQLMQKSNHIRHKQQRINEGQQIEKTDNVNQNNNGKNIGEFMLLKTVDVNFTVLSKKNREKTPPQINCIPEENQQVSNQNLTKSVQNDFVSKDHDVNQLVNQPQKNRQKRNDIKREKKLELSNNKRHSITEIGFKKISMSKDIEKRRKVVIGQFQKQSKRFNNQYNALPNDFSSDNHDLIRNSHNNSNNHQNALSEHLNTSHNTETKKITFENENVRNHIHRGQIIDRNADYPEFGTFDKQNRTVSTCNKQTQEQMTLFKERKYIKSPKISNLQLSLQGVSCPSDLHELLREIYKKMQIMTQMFDQLITKQQYDSDIDLIFRAIRVCRQDAQENYANRKETYKAILFMEKKLWKLQDIFEGQNHEDEQEKDSTTITQKCLSCKKPCLIKKKSERKSLWSKNDDISKTKKVDLSQWIKKTSNLLTVKQRHSGN